MKNVFPRLRAARTPGRCGRAFLASLAALAATLGTLPAQAQLPTVPARAAVESAPSVGASGFAQAALGMALVLGLIFLCAWVARRFGLQRLGSGNLVKVVSSASVGQRERVVVVEVGATWLVLGVTPTQVNALHTLAAPHAPLAPVPAPTSTAPGGLATGSAIPAAPSKASNAATFALNPVSQFAQKLHESLSGKATFTHP